MARGRGDLPQHEAGTRTGNVLQAREQLAIKARAAAPLERSQEADQHEHGGEQVGVRREHDRPRLVQEVLDIAKHAFEATRFEEARVDAVDPHALLGEILFELVDARLKSEILSGVPGHGLWQPQKETCRASFSHHVVELGGILPPTEPHQSRRMDPRNL